MATMMTIFPIVGTVLALIIGGGLYFYCRKKNASKNQPRTILPSTMGAPGYQPQGATHVQQPQGSFQMANSYSQSPLYPNSSPFAAKEPQSSFNPSQAPALPPGFSN